MKVYLHSNGIFYEKQADAPSKSWEAVEFDFNTSPKSNFIKWLNENYSPSVHKGAEPEPCSPLPACQRAAEVAAKPAPTPREPRAIMAVDAVLDFVLDKATNADIESLFSALGARFHEARKESAMK